MYALPLRDNTSRGAQAVAPACIEDFLTGPPMTLIPPSVQLSKSYLEENVELSFASKLTAPGLEAYSIAAGFSASVN